MRSYFFIHHEGKEINLPREDTMSNPGWYRPVIALLIRCLYPAELNEHSWPKCQEVIRRWCAT